MSANDASSEPSLELKSSSVFERLKPIWPVLACGIGMMLLSAIGFMIIEYRWRGFGRLQLYAESIVISFILAQIALVTILGSLITRHWLTGWLLAVVLSCVQTVTATIIAEFPNVTGTEAVRNLALCSVWPAFLLSTCAPLVVLRTLLGWTLARKSQAAIPRWRSSLEDLIVVGVVIACSITTSQMFLYSEGPQTLPQLLVIMSIFAATSLICVPPVVYVTFRSPNWRRRIAGWLLLSVMAFVVIFVESGIIEGNGWQTSMRFLPQMIVGVISSCVTMAVGMASLLVSGYRLTHFERSTKNSPVQASSTQTDPTVSVTEESTVPAPRATPGDAKAPFEAEWLDDAQPRSQSRPFEFTPQWQARIVALVFVGIAVLGASSVHFAKLRTLKFYEELAQLDVQNAYTDKQTVNGLQFGPNFVDSDLKQYLKYRDSILTLSFANTKITDAIVPELKAFPALRELDLSGTAITDAGLQTLELPNQRIVNPDGTTGFPRLCLADTQVTWAAVQELARHNTICHLDLSGLQIKDDDLATRIAVKSLRLSRNPITDEGLRALLEKSSLRRLDVSDTAITGSTLNVAECPQRLNLDGTAINDATLTAILKTGNVIELSLRRTSITAAVLPLLVNKSLRLGKGAITENDLATLGRANFEHLGLNDKQFTGKCMTTGTLSTSSLDLSDSSVTDDILFSIGGKGIGFQYLGLANTQVSDACIPYLQSVMEIDIRGTRITFSGLGNRSYYGPVVSHNQFTPRELNSLHNTQGQFTQRPRFSKWQD